MKTRYIVATVLIIAASLLSACGESAYTEAEARELNRAQAQLLVDQASYACRDGKEYLVYDRGPYVSITATGVSCFQIKTH